MKVLDAILCDRDAQDGVILDIVPLSQPSVTDPFAQMWDQDGNQTAYVIED